MDQRYRNFAPIPQFLMIFVVSAHRKLELVLSNCYILFDVIQIEVPSDCRMYLADVGIPKGIFSAVDIKYTSPFEDKFVIALNE